MENSKIEWTHHTFNPWWGCTKISDGCTNCYANSLDSRFGGDHWGPKAMRKPMSNAQWSKPLKWNREAEKAGERRRVFCASMADVFEVHENMGVNNQLNGWRNQLWEIIIATPMLDWLLLTKRPENLYLLPQTLLVGNRMNIWLGVTAENQKQADIRIPLLFKKSGSAAVRFVSYEPALGPIDIKKYLANGPAGNGINWVIAGAESGPGKRPMNEDWVRSVRDQCAGTDAQFLYKQKISDNKKVSLPILDGNQHAAFPEVAR